MIEIKANSKPTYADKIRNMTDEELTEFLNEISSHSEFDIKICRVCKAEHNNKCTMKDNECRYDGYTNKEIIKVWLQSEVKESD